MELPSPSFVAELFVTWKRGVSSFSPLELVAKFGALGLLAAATWRFKENLGRILDRTEPRIGDDVPMEGKREGEVLAAFMIHPLTLEDFWQAKRFAWMRPLVDRGVISEASVRSVAASLRPMKIGELHGIRTVGGQRIRAYLLSSPLLPDVFQATATCADAAVDLVGVPYEFWSLALFVIVETVALWLLVRERAAA